MKDFTLNGLIRFMGKHGEELMRECDALRKKYGDISPEAQRKMGNVEELYFILNYIMDQVENSYNNIQLQKADNKAKVIDIMSYK